MSTEELLEAVRAYAQERFPRTPAVRVSIELIDGDKVKLRIPDASGAVKNGSSESLPQINSTERRILRAAAELDDENPTGEEIATAAKLPYQPHFKKMLSALRSEGMLGGLKGDVGYPITPLGLRVIQLED